MRQNEDPTEDEEEDAPELPTRRETLKMLEAFEAIWDRVPLSERGVYKAREQRLRNYLDSVRLVIEHEASESVDDLLERIGELTQEQRELLFDRIGEEWCSTCGRDLPDSGECGVCDAPEKKGGGRSDLDDEPVAKV